MDRLSELKGSVKDAAGDVVEFIDDKIDDVPIVVGEFRALVGQSTTIRRSSKYNRRENDRRGARITQKHNENGNKKFSSPFI